VSKVGCEYTAIGSSADEQLSLRQDICQDTSQLNDWLGHCSNHPCLGSARLWLCCHFHDVCHRAGVHKEEIPVVNSAQLGANRYSVPEILAQASGTITLNCPFFEISPDESFVSKTSP
jgi:hypothetical protein